MSKSLPPDSQLAGGGLILTIGHLSYEQCPWSTLLPGGEVECSNQSAGQHLSGPVPTHEREAGLLGFSGQLGSMMSGNGSIMTLSYFSR